MKKRRYQIIAPIHNQKLRARFVWALKVVKRTMQVERGKKEKY